MSEYDQEEEICYSRQDTIAAVTEFYEFLKKLYLNDSDVIYPPPGGWPSITNADPTVLELLGKSDEVLALIAHLPYIRLYEGWDDGPEAMPDCHFADWHEMIGDLSNRVNDPHPPSITTSVESLRIRTEGSFHKLALPHVIGLTAGGDEDAPVIIIDTKLGVVLWEQYTMPSEFVDEYGAEGAPHDYPDPDEDMPEEEVDLRVDAGSWEITTFLKILQRQFTKLRWIPTSHYTLRSENLDENPGGKEDGMTALLQSIYRQHGWPDDLDRYQKDECLEAVNEALQEHFPDSHYSSDYREEQAE